MALWTPCNQVDHNQFVIGSSNGQALKQSFFQGGSQQLFLALSSLTNDYTTNITHTNSIHPTKQEESARENLADVFLTRPRWKATKFRAIISHTHIFDWPRRL